jgi:hypothetical protein
MLEIFKVQMQSLLTKIELTALGIHVSYITIYGNTIVKMNSKYEVQNITNRKNLKDIIF